MVKKTNVILPFNCYITLRFSLNFRLSMDTIIYYYRYMNIFSFSFLIMWNQISAETIHFAATKLRQLTEMRAGSQHPKSNKRRSYQN